MTPMIGVIAILGCFRPHPPLPRCNPYDPNENDLLHRGGCTKEGWLNGAGSEDPALLSGPSLVPVAYTQGSPNFL